MGIACILSGLDLIDVDIDGIIEPAKEAFEC
jgi:hypothetical protein